MAQSRVVITNFIPLGKEIVGGMDIYVHSLVHEIKRDEEFLKEYKVLLASFYGDGKRDKHSWGEEIRYKYDNSKTTTENNREFKKFVESIAKDKDIIINNDWFGIPHRKRRIEVVHSLEVHRSLLVSNNEVTREERKAIEGARQVITVSSLMKEEINKYFGRDSEVIYPSYSLPPKKQECRNKQEERSKRTQNKNIKDRKEFQLLFVGRLERQKNIENLLKGMSLLSEEIKQNISLKIIGRGSMEIRLKKYASYLKLHNVKFLGYVSREELYNHYYKSDALIMPSYFEPFGIVGYDAYVNSLPLLSTSKAGCLEIIPSGDKEVFDPFIPYEIADSIEKEYEKHKKTKQRSAKGKKEGKKKIRKWNEVWEEMKEHIISLT